MDVEQSLSMDPIHVELDDGQIRGFLKAYFDTFENPGDIGNEVVAQFRVMLEALRKFQERDQKHRGLWRYFGAIDSAHQARAKATRVYNVAIQLLRGGPVDDAEDDAIDLINYAVFFVRNARENRYG